MMQKLQPGKKKREESPLGKLKDQPKKSKTMKDISKTVQLPELKKTLSEK